MGWAACLAETRRRSSPAALRRLGLKRQPRSPQFHQNFYQALLVVERPVELAERTC